MPEPTIFLDYASTSPVDPDVAATMAACLTAEGAFANAASLHGPGIAARRVVEEARAHIGALVNARPDRIVFTSGATEANNLALKGRMRLAGKTGHLITTAIEHPSVLDAAHALEREGFAVTRLPCDSGGRIHPEQIAEALRPDTRLVSVMQVNNEIGTVQDIASISEICRNSGVTLHVDAAQAAGKVPLDIAGWQLGLCSLTAHKLNGPKGIGALYVRSDLTLSPLVHGGDGELGLRAGTLATHQIAGFGRAFELAAAGTEPPRLEALREQLWHGLSRIDGARRNGDARAAVPHILSVSFPGIDGESLKYALADIAVSAGSACTSRDPAPSHVLRALGLSAALAECTLRFGVGRFTTPAEISTAIGRVRDEVERLRALGHGAPDWCYT